MIKDKHLSVSQFVSQLKGVVSNHPAFRSVSIVGEISNFKAHHSGHFYFSLKDSGGRIACVMFKTSASTVAFKPKDGDRVVIKGRVDVFESTGTVQIYVNSMLMDGVGDLYVQYEKLRKMFEAQGYFDAKYKKPLPLFPERIGVITGEGSAAYRDISITLQTRWPLAEQIDLLAFVQGENAVASLVENLKKADAMNLDVIIFGRGGGSIEDLWAFNEQAVVEQLFAMKTPVVSGIGHESDVTLSDFVADHRGATPTAATVAATPDKTEIEQSLRNYKNLFYTRVRNSLLQKQHAYKSTVSQSKLNDPLQLIYLKQQRLDYYQSQLMAFHQSLRRYQARIQNYPLQFSNALNQQIQIQRNQMNRLNERMAVQQTHNIQKQTIAIRYHKETIQKALTRYDFKIKETRDGIERLDAQFIKQIQYSSNLKEKALIDIIKTIDKLEPTQRLAAIFRQGFGRIKHENQTVTSVFDVALNETLTIELSDGTLETQIIGKETKDDTDI